MSIQSVTESLSRGYEALPPRAKNALRGTGFAFASVATFFSLVHQEQNTDRFHNSTKVKVITGEVILTLAFGAAAIHEFKQMCRNN